MRLIVVHVTIINYVVCVPFVVSVIGLQYPRVAAIK